MKYNKYLRYILFLLVFVLFTGIDISAASEKFIVVIDAGHGGKDPGAMDNDLREKDINLAVAKKVAEMLRKKRKDIQVILTRDKDRYLTLQQRADIANKAKADLFISIHTNSLDTKNPNRTTIEGASTYTLGPNKDKENLDVAKRENKVITIDEDFGEIYNDFDPDNDESYIIFELSQKANMANSIHFANMVQKRLVNTAGRVDRGVKQAGFWVLWATAMPSVLIELDFITNPEKALFLSNPKGQEKLAEAIYQAADGYFKALAQERKNTEKESKKNKEKKIAVDPKNSVTLAASTGVRRENPTRINSGNGQRKAQGSATPRRRRNNRSKAYSENRQYEIAVIEDQSQYVANSNDFVVTDDSFSDNEVAFVADTSTTKDKNSKNKKNNKKEEKANNKKANNKQDKKKDKQKNNNSATPQKRIVNGKEVILGSTDNSGNSQNQSKPNSGSYYIAQSQGENVPSSETASVKKNNVKTASKNQSSDKKETAVKMEKKSNTKMEVASEREIKPSSKEQSVSTVSVNGRTSKTEPQNSSDVRTKETSEKQLANNFKPSNKSNSAVKMEKRTSVYRIVIVSSKEKLASNDPQFKGLTPEKYIFDGNNYNYIFGESDSEDEIKSILADLKSTFPNAYYKRYYISR